MGKIRHRTRGKIAAIWYPAAASSCPRAPDPRLIYAITSVVLENNRKLQADILAEVDRGLADEIVRALRRHGIRG